MPIPPWLSPVPRPEDKGDAYGPGICSWHGWPHEHLRAACPDCAADGLESMGHDPAGKHGRFAMYSPDPVSLAPKRDDLAELEVTERRLVRLQLGAGRPFYSWDPFPTPG